MRLSLTISPRRSAGVQSNPFPSSGETARRKSGQERRLRANPGEPSNMNPLSITFNSGQPYTDRLHASQLADQLIRCGAAFSYVKTKGGYDRIEFLYEQDFALAKTYMSSRAHKDTHQLSVA
jgi:hypothetical protein